MRAVIDSSSWISMARSGLLGLVAAAAVEAVLVDAVHAEIVDEGRRGGHVDAVALAAATADATPVATEPDGSADDRVLEASRGVGVLVANDLALGRRARSLGVAWIRTADLVVIAVRRRSMTTESGAQALDALVASGRITEELATAYREVLQ